MQMFSACNQAEPASQQWPGLEAASVQNTAPGDVVLFVAGNWECEDILHNGRWSNITQPSFQLYLLAEMELAVRIGTAHGAHFDFTTMAAMDNGTVGDAPIRRRIYNHLLEVVASQSPSSVSLIDLGDILSPQVCSPSTWMVSRYGLLTESTPRPMHRETSSSTTPARPSPTPLITGSPPVSGR